MKRLKWDKVVKEYNSDQTQRGGVGWGFDGNRRGYERHEMKNPFLNSFYKFFF